MAYGQWTEIGAWRRGRESTQTLMGAETLNSESIIREFGLDPVETGRRITSVIGGFGSELVTGWKPTAQAESPRFQAFDLVECSRLTSRGERI